MSQYKEGDRWDTTNLVEFPINRIVRFVEPPAVTHANWALHFRKRTQWNLMKDMRSEMMRWPTRSSR